MAKLDSLNRLRRIGQTFARHGLFGLVDQLGLSDSGLTATPEPDELRAARFGRRLSMALNDLGPTFVKLGQILATREDMFPQAVVRELGQLQDNATPFAASVARAEVEAALGCPISARFAAFDDTPLAAGSIAQVHRATLADTTDAAREVVVKIRRPGIRAVVADDLELLAQAAALIAKRVPAIARHDPVAFVQEFGKHLEAELDFRREARVLALVQGRLGRGVKAPRPVSALCTESVLVQSFIRGHKVSELHGAADRHRAAEALAASFARQYLGDGVFHADPHSGNILRQNDGVLALIDWGAVGAVSAPMRRALLGLALAAAARDTVGLAERLLGVVHCPDALDRATAVAEIAAFAKPLLGEPLDKVDAATVLRESFALVQRFGLRLQTDYFLLLRSFLLIEGVVRSLDAGVDPIRATRAFILRSGWQPRWWVPASRLLWRAAWRRWRQWPTKRRCAVGLAALALLGALFGLGVVAWRARAVPAGPKVEADASVESPTSLRLAQPCVLFARPSRQSKVVARLEAGQAVTALAATEFFRKVRTARGEVGYVLSGCTAAP